MNNMYLIFYNNNGKIKKMECISLKNAKQTKEIIEREEKKIVCIMAKTFLNGIDEVMDLMLKDDFLSAIKLCGKIDEIEIGLL